MNSFKTVLLIGVFVVSFVYAQSSPVTVNEKIQKIALYKNGFGFFVSQVECPKNETSFVIIPPAAPSHGTFWAIYSPSIELESITSKEVSVNFTTPVSSIPELLKANIDKEVWLSFDDEDKNIYVGTLLSFSDNLIILKNDKEELAVNPSSVKKVKFANGKVIKTQAAKDKSLQYEFKLAKPANGKAITLCYLAKGIVWTPSYMINLSEDDKAAISGQALIFNEICDSNDTEIQLITGFPNLKFADIISPMAKKENIAQFLQSIVRSQKEFGFNAGITSNVMMQSRESKYKFEQEFAGPDYGLATGGIAAEDLFLYPLKNIKLSKGQVSYHPLFTETLEYKHIYQWDIPDYINQFDQYYHQQPKDKEQQEIVWHSLRMKNSTKVPWTTAPAEIIKDGVIIGQDKISYTPVNGKTTLKITQALDIKAEQIEIETQRQRDALHMYGNSYDLITLTGKLSLNNYKNQPVTLEIQKTLSGELKSSDPNANIENLAAGLSRMNATRILRWTIELEPKEKKELNYIYDVYVRR
ncbi:MAG: hypothetical protein ABFD79_02205 [Phycisphaerales bacterium]